MSNWRVNFLYYVLHVMKNVPDIFFQNFKFKGITRKSALQYGYHQRQLLYSHTWCEYEIVCSPPWRNWDRACIYVIRENISIRSLLGSLAGFGTQTKQTVWFIQYCFKNRNKWIHTPLSQLSKLHMLLYTKTETKTVYRVFETVCFLVTLYIIFAYTVE